MADKQIHEPASDNNNLRLLACCLPFFLFTRFFSFGGFIDHKIEEQ